MSANLLLHGLDGAIGYITAQRIPPAPVRDRRVTPAIARCSHRLCDTGCCAIFTERLRR